MKTKKAFCKASLLEGCGFEGIVEVEIIAAQDHLHCGGLCWVKDSTGKQYNEVEMARLFKEETLANAYKLHDFGDRVDDMYLGLGRDTYQNKKAYFYKGELKSGYVKLHHWDIEKDNIILEIDGGSDTIPLSDVRLYRSIEDAKKCEILKTNYLDGTTKEEGGAFLKYRLNERQKELVETLKNAIKMCEDAGILLHVNAELGSLYAINNESGDLGFGELGDKNAVPLQIQTCVSGDYIMDTNECWGAIKKD